MQEQVIQDAENDYLEKECEHLQKLLEEKEQQLAAIQAQSPASDSDGMSAACTSAASALDSDTATQASSLRLDPEPGLRDHKAMHDAYQFVVGLVGLEVLASLLQGFGYHVCVYDDVLVYHLCKLH